MTADLLVETAEQAALPLSLRHILENRGFRTPEAIQTLLNPSLDDLHSPHGFPHMGIAVEALRGAIFNEEPIAIYADRDVDGLSGLAILMRTLRTLGGQVHWGSPLNGRGVQRAVLQTLIQEKKARILILVDCGTGEEAEISWLNAQGVKVIVADHHRLGENPPAAFAWIHPGMIQQPSQEVPAGCVMAFKLAHALWLSFLGEADPARLDYFLFDHLDLLCLGILADRMPLTGENRTFVWHGLRRLPKTRKVGLESLMRFFRLIPKTGPLTVREASWQIIPMLNAAGRLGQPEWTADLLTTEDPWTARECIDQLLDLNTQRRSAQLKSVEYFEKVVLEQCSMDSDPILIAMAKGLEPSVTGLAAQALVKKYGRPAFLFVDQGEHSVGSARGTGEVDLFAAVEEHQALLVKFGGHQGAVGMTLRTVDYAVFRERLMDSSRRKTRAVVEVSSVIEAQLFLTDLNDFWWEQFQRLEPFGPGFPCPVFQINGVESIEALNRRKVQSLRLKQGARQIPAEMESGRAPLGAGPWQIIGYPAAARKGESGFKWIIQAVAKTDSSTRVAEVRSSKEESAAYA